MTAVASPGWRVRSGRLTRHLRFRVTASATLAAVVLALAGAVVFAVLFQQSLQNTGDDALRTIAATTSTDLRAQTGEPRLTAVAANARSTVVQLIRPDHTVAQTVTAATSLGAPVSSGHTTLATTAQVDSAASQQVFDTVRHARVLLTPIPRADGTWVLLVASDLEQLDDATHDAEATFVIATPIVVVAIALGAWILSGAVLRPVTRIRIDAAGIKDAAAAGRFTDGQVHRPDSGDEIESLARTINDLLGEVHAASERQRHLVADAGHELRTPLAVLSAELELADRDGRSLAYVRDAVSHARREVGRLSDLAEDLLLLSDAEHRVARDAGAVSLVAVAGEAVRAHRAVAAARGVTLDLAPDPGSPVLSGHADSVRRAVDNLIGNAIAVAQTRVSVVVTTDRGGHAVLGVEDDGPGFTEDFLPHAFERFRRADDDRHRTGPAGAGLGLAIVAAVAAAHGGTARAENTGHGARVSLVLPVR